MTDIYAASRTNRTERLRGWRDGLLGVVIFSASLPATRVAVLEIEPLFLTAVRAAIAGLIALGAVLLLREQRPGRSDLAPLVVVAGGVVVGFPLLTALALREITSARGIVLIALLPLSTALFAVLRAGERPRTAFWAFAVGGAVLVAGYALARGGGGTAAGDGLMVAAVVVCGFGYAEGARLSRRLEGWQVISWALILSLPLTIPLAVVLAPPTWQGVGIRALLGLAYVSVFSMLVGFVFWYRGLARGGIAAVGQLQLLQPFLGLILAAALLDEPVGWDMLLALVGVAACVAGARRWAT